MKKSVSADGDQFISFSLPITAKNLSYVGLRRRIGVALGIDCRESGEIVLADYGCGGCHDRCFIQRVGVVIHLASYEGRANFSAMNAVPVRLGLGRVARVEGWRCFFGRENANGGRQDVVQRPGQVIGRQRVLEGSFLVLAGPGPHAARNEWARHHRIICLGLRNSPEFGACAKMFSSRRR